MQRLDDIRAGEHQMFVEAVVAHAAVVVGRQVQALDVRPGCPVEDDDVIFNSIQVAPVGVGACLALSHVVHVSVNTFTHK